MRNQVSFLALASSGVFSCLLKRSVPRSCRVMNHGMLWIGAASNRLAHERKPHEGFDDDRVD
jgi:hypothetical protein